MAAPTAMVKKINQQLRLLRSKTKFGSTNCRGQWPPLAVRKRFGVGASVEVVLFRLAVLASSRATSPPHDRNGRLRCRMVRPSKGFVIISAGLSLPGMWNNWWRCAPMSSRTYSILVRMCFITVVCIGLVSRLRAVVLPGGKISQ